MRPSYETVGPRSTGDALPAQAPRLVLCWLSWTGSSDQPLPGWAPGSGVPIGNLTSQCFANGKLELYRGLAAIREFLHATLRIDLLEEGNLLEPVIQSVPFLGFRVFPSVGRLDHRKLVRMRRNIRQRESAHRLGGIIDSLETRKQQFVASLGLGRPLEERPRLPSAEHATAPDGAFKTAPACQRLVQTVHSAPARSRMNTNSFRQQGVSAILVHV